MVTKEIKGLHNKMSRKGDTHGKYMHTDWTSKITTKVAASEEETIPKPPESNNVIYDMGQLAICTALLENLTHLATMPYSRWTDHDNSSIVPDLGA